PAPRAEREREADGTPGSRLRAALRNLDEYLQRAEVFQNPGGGGGDYESHIQFDSKGVDFGPWLRRFIAQIRRNWIIPQAAYLGFKGHVAITFYIDREGRIAELTVRRPSGVDSFDRAAFNALAWSNPTEPLPAAYPDDRALFTVTFYYNETPPR
ncbi:MAG TPA: TonB family protein, partial [Vicinamibacterales bacterium]|nr:TonB family protein [Vicinamibacterales bacterium]